MRLPTDPESAGLVKALRPFLSDRGQAAVDDLLGSVNLISIFDSLGDLVKKRRGGGSERPLAFLSSLAYMDIDPKTIAKAVDSMMDATNTGASQSGPGGDSGRAKGGSGQPGSPGPAGGPKPDDIAKMLQSVMSRAAADPGFAAALGSLAEEGMKSNMFPKLLESLGPDLMPKDDQDQSRREQ